MHHSSRRLAGRTAARHLLLATTLLAAGPAPAEELPQPPCGGVPPLPAYGGLDAPPNVGVWSPEPLDEPGLPHVRFWTGEELFEWPPPACTDWTSLPFTVALAGRFRHQGDAQALLARLGAVEALGRLTYWAAARQRWEPLYEAAHAVAGPEGRERRGDFMADEMQPGQDLHIHLDPNGPVGGATYRLHVREAGRDRFMATLDNATSARVAGLIPLAPETLRFLYVVERLPDEGADRWGYYGLVGLGISPNSARTYVNRNVAIFRHVAGIPADQEPPVWP